MTPSSNMKAVLILAEHKHLAPLLKPALDVERDSIKWEQLGYHGQSGGVQVALSWAYCLFCDEVPPRDWDYRDPFSHFFSLDRDIQVLVLKALAIRHGFLDLSVEDRPKSAFELFIEKATENMAKEEAKKNLRVVGSNFRPGLLGDADVLLARANLPPTVCADKSSS